MAQQVEKKDEQKDGKGVREAKAPGRRPTPKVVKVGGKLYHVTGYRSSRYTPVDGW